MARRLTDKQQRRIKQNQQQTLDQHNDSSDSSNLAARVITNFGKTIIAY